MEIYLVGGAVRDKLLDKLLGRPIANRDHDWVVVGATPDDLIQQGYIPVGKDFPVFLHPKTHEEYALARKERKVRPGYHGFECQFDPSVTLEEDLRRRDLTINAMAERDDKIIDPYQGQMDLKNRLLRHVSPAFVEDPVRVLRVARFAARFSELGFHVAKDTMALMQEMVQRGEIDALVPERVWKEWERALLEPTPWVFFEILWQSNALRRLAGFETLVSKWDTIKEIAINHLFPALFMATSLTMIDPNKALVRFSALALDLVRNVTVEKTQVIEKCCDHYKIPNQYRELALLAIEWCHRCCEIAKKEKYDRAVALLKFLKSTDAFRRSERFFQFLTVCEAEAKAKSGVMDFSKPLFERAYEIAKNVTIHSLSKQKQSLQGPLLGAAIDELRLEQLSQL